ncbi:MAG TPA: phosphatase [Candidatus Scatavimonas merdigallinarum]|uniref:Phosphatase n=1 Tax=Candidatus Scatavimonas merdigallinarum TaxID=2840914 RepID=A0A9D1CUW6_9FIRM|nr:phosphatase [Candidatus Scatavimonas merdigallinarum]
MKIIADTHTHTVASTHAYSTAQEMITAAKEKGLYAIALTDHAYRMPGAPGEWFFENLHAIPSTLYGVRVLRGMEANVIDFNGNLDAPQNIQKSMEWIVASIHGLLLDGEPSYEACTQLWLRVAENPHVRVIGHSGAPAYAYDYEKVIPQFAAQGKLIEINNATFRVRKSSVENCMKIAKACKKAGAYIVVNSDAHFSTAVGNADLALAMLAEIDFPQELVVNADTGRFKDYLRACGISL